MVNKLNLNVAKTKYMIFSKRNKNINPIYLNINNNVIEHVHQFYFLGLHLNSRLTGNTHIEEISKNISRTIGVLKKLQLTVPKNILLIIYNALILTQINYFCYAGATILLRYFSCRKIYSNHLRC